LEDHETRLLQAESGVLANGSFEVDDGAGDPENWTIVETGAASRALTTTEADVAHGLQAESATMTVASGDGVKYTSANYAPVGDGQRVHFSALVKNASGIKITAKILWYYWTGAAFAAATTSSTTVYSASETLSAYALLLGSAVVPAGTHDGRYWRLEIEVGGTGETTAGTVYLDGIECGPDSKPALTGTTSVWTNTDGTGTVSVATALGNERPNAVLLSVRAGTGAGSESVTIQGWDGTAWQNVGVVLSTTAYADQQTMTVTLNADREFNVSASTLTNGSISLVGTM
jgi:hypothetical protein